MEWITIVDWPGGSVADFDWAHTEKGDPDALVARYVGTFEGDLRIVAVWQSREGAEAFFASMPQEIGRRLAPRTNGIPTVAAFTSERSWTSTPVS